MNRIREISLTQYIGAIVVAFISSQGLIHLVILVTTPLRWYFEFRNRHSASVFSTPTDFALPWDSLILVCMNVLLFLVAYVLVRWLYPSEPKVDREAEGSPAS